jgi:phosphatidylglycerol---prolipoprotein diacylglyceryl transferase
MQPPTGPVLIEIGPIAIYWYGFLIATGILMGARVATYLADRAGEDSEAIWDMMIIVVVLAIIGSRLYHVFSSPESGLLGWDYYRENPAQIFAIWDGGLGFYGALVGGAVGTAIFCYFRNLKLLQWFDFLAPGMAIGQAIGRWGNYMNRELYGPPTDLPWGLRIPPQYRIPPFNDLTQYPEGTLFHPTFLYESLGLLVVCVLLILIADRYRERLHHGDLFFGYLMASAVIRFLIEFLRPDAWILGPLAAAQVFALILFLLCAGVLVWRHLLARNAGPTH